MTPPTALLFHGLLLQAANETPGSPAWVFPDVSDSHLTPGGALATGHRAEVRPYNTRNHIVELPSLRPCTPGSYYVHGSPCPALPSMRMSVPRPISPDCAARSLT